MRSKAYLLGLLALSSCWAATVSAQPLDGGVADAEVAVPQAEPVPVPVPQAEPVPVPVLVPIPVPEAEPVPVLVPEAEPVPAEAEPEAEANPVPAPGEGDPEPVDTDPESALGVDAISGADPVVSGSASDFFFLPESEESALDEFFEAFREMVPSQWRARWVLVALLLLFGPFAFWLSLSVRRRRERLPDSGLIPSALGALDLALRLASVVAALFLVAVLVPERFGPLLLFFLVAAALALGWSVRELLPDLLARVVILFEWRIRRGEWVRGPDFAGTVMHVGLRATILRDVRGHRVWVPNRALLASPLMTDASIGAEQEVTLRLRTSAPASDVRQAIRDAVLLSPWVPPTADPVVLRDPKEPQLWHVRTPLLEARFAMNFEGELLERAEEILEERAPKAQIRNQGWSRDE